MLLKANNNKDDDAVKEPTEWKKTFANDKSVKELISKTDKEFIQLNIKKKKNKKQKTKTLQFKNEQRV